MKARDIVSTVESSSLQLAWR